MSKVKYWFLIKYLYRHVLRDLLLKAIDDPNTEWDNYIMSICDRIFDYDSKDTLVSGINNG